MNCGMQLDDATKFCRDCGTRCSDAKPPEKPPAPQPVAQPAPPQRQQYNQPTTAKPKKKSKLPIILAIVGVLAVVAIAGGALLVSFGFGVLSKAAKEDYYTIGNDQIPSIKMVLGEEYKVTGISTSTGPGDVTQKTIKYNAPGTGQSQAMLAYHAYLHDHDGFLNLATIMLSGSSGIGLVGRNSVDSGYEIQLQIEYDTSSFTITILKQQGGIVPNPPTSAVNTTTPPTSSTPTVTVTPALSPSSVTTSSSTSKPTPVPGTTGSLTGGFFQTMQSGTFHIKVVMAEDGLDMEMDLYAKDGMLAMVGDLFGMSMRIVNRDGKSYTIIDDVVLMVDDIEDDDMPFLTGTSTLAFVGEGSGTFNGKTCKYDEYVSSNGARSFYFVDGGKLVGVRTIIDGMTSETGIVALDKDVPSNVFVIPSS